MLASRPNLPGSLRPQDRWARPIGVLVRVCLMAAIAGGVVAAGRGWFFGSEPRIEARQSVNIPDEARHFRFRMVFGLADKTPTRWDGTVHVSPGNVAKIDGWLLERDDEIQGTSGWKIASRRSRPLGEPADLIPPDRWPVVESGVIVAVADGTPHTQVEVQVPGQKFSFTLGELEYGKRVRLLDGAVEVERVPSSVQLTNTAAEQDFPAAAVSSDGTVWVAYVEFTQNSEYERRRQLSREPPEDFDYLAGPAMGDQVLLVKYSGDRWVGAFPVSKANSDVYRCAVAVDGQDRVWVIWSQNVDNNFDLYARAFDPKGAAWPEIRLTRSLGSDIHPVAATDASGRVWVAWQSFRGTNSDIFVASQEKDGFSEPRPLTATDANEWEPAIAAARDGRIAVAWDTYSKGDYDVFFRVAAQGADFGPATAVAASRRFEVRPSIAYDPGGRLWVAWEDASERWGKDFGSHDTNGAGLYHSRSIQVKVFQDGGIFRPATSPGVALLGAEGAALSQPRSASPDPSLAAQRPAHLSPQVPPNPKNSFPQLVVDAKGRVCIAYRSIWPPLRYQIRTLWFESLACYDGERWTGPIFVPDTDNLLDNRPAVVALPDGRLLLVHSRDYRAASFSTAPAARFNNDLYSSQILLPGQAPVMRLARDSAEQQTVDPLVLAERRDIERARATKVDVQGKELRLMRGEFHRHTEISLDGGTDGSLVDMWRYGLDVASMDWMGNGDHDNGHGREYYWWLVQKTTDAYFVGRNFVSMFSYERSLPYPEGHRNVVFARRGVRPLARLQPRVKEDDPGSSPDTLMLYRYLKQFNGVSSPHSSATDMGTDWRDNDPAVETSVEIYQGDRQSYEMPGAPRSNSESDSIGGWRPKGFVSRALEKGYRLAFQASSDHYSNHISYCNIWSESPTRDGILNAFQRRHLYGATDNIIAVVRSGEHFMGDEFQTDKRPLLDVRLEGTRPFARVSIIKDGRYVYSTEPRTQTVEFQWRDNRPQPARTSYYYVRGEQVDGELVWVSPMWIRYTGR